MEGELVIIDRTTKEKFTERVFGGRYLKFIYGQNRLGKSLVEIISRFSPISKLFGLWQRGPWTKKHVSTFIEAYHVEEKEFAKTNFSSFNDFFIRKLKKETRPISSHEVVIPADGRYVVYENFSTTKEILVKGEKFSLFELLGRDKALTEKFTEGSVVVARLAPPDYHRFHFPVEATRIAVTPISGALYSVNPFALKGRLENLTKNKRVVVQLTTNELGLVVCVVIGATCVGSIHFTHNTQSPPHKGDEMGYFSFGGSMLITLFEPGYIKLSPDLVGNSQKGFETLCKMGQELGRKPL